MLHTGNFVRTQTLKTRGNIEYNAIFNLVGDLSALPREGTSLLETFALLPHRIGFFLVGPSTLNSLPSDLCTLLQYLSYNFNKLLKTFLFDWARLGNTSK